MTTVEIRGRRIDDMASCIEAMAAVHEADRYPSRWPDDPGAFLSPPDVLDAWVAVESATVLGHVLLREAKDEREELGEHATGLSDALVSVSRLFVPPAARGRGVARLLLDAVARSARTRGSEVILSVVDDSGPAIAMYEHLGWRYLTTKAATWKLQNGETPIVRYYRQPAN